MVREVIDHGEHVYTVVLEALTSVPQFKPGQFLHLALDQYQGDGFWPESRAFSIASSPDERDRLQIMYAVKRLFTSRMEHELRPGREVWVKLPYGDFVVEANRDAVLFAGGTGFTAFAAFLESLPANLAWRVQLYYGARTPELLVYRPLVETTAARVPRFSSTMVCEQTDGQLSVDSAWPAIARLDDPAVYLSGPPAMLATLSQQLRARGLAARDIRTDAWE